jgi:hypothetical protein
MNCSNMTFGLRTSADFVPDALPATAGSEASSDCDRYRTCLPSLGTTIKTRLILFAMKGRMGANA